MLDGLSGDIGGRPAWEWGIGGGIVLGVIVLVMKLRSQGSAAPTGGFLLQPAQSSTWPPFAVEPVNTDSSGGGGGGGGGSTGGTGGGVTGAEPPPDPGPQFVSWTDLPSTTRQQLVDAGMFRTASGQDNVPGPGDTSKWNPDLIPTELAQLNAYKDKIPAKAPAPAQQTTGLTA